MVQPTAGLARLLGAALALLAAAVPLSASALTFKIDIQTVRMKDPKHPPKASELKSRHDFAKRIDQKTIDHHVVKAAFGMPVELVLPNGAHLTLTALSYKKPLFKVHVRLLVMSSAGLDMDLKLPENGKFPLPAGPWNDSLLMVQCTPSMD
jgi:hypothetical protein